MSSAGCSPASTPMRNSQKAGSSKEEPVSKKCFFETLPIPEDLDFTLRNEARIEEGFLKRVFGEVGAWIYDETGIEVPG